MIEEVDFLTTIENGEKQTMQLAEIQTFNSWFSPLGGSVSSFLNSEQGFNWTRCLYLLFPCCAFIRCLYLLFECYSDILLM